MDSCFGNAKLREAADRVVLTKVRETCWELRESLIPVTSSYVERVHIEAAQVRSSGELRCKLCSSVEVVHMAQQVPSSLRINANLGSLGLVTLSSLKVVFVSTKLNVEVKVHVLVNLNAVSVRAVTTVAHT